ncbi:MAG: M23 family metallopeptidase [Flavobacteriales bacterium]|nr:M23 family metallopeptidase [Flavobacteriales bacterium]
MFKVKKAVLLLWFISAVALIKAQDLVIPIAGTYGDDYIIVNYPDWHIEDGPVLVEDGVLMDHRCGTKTYDGHQGTDFVIRGFTQMDSLVDVLASADGEVIQVIDDLFDRETEGIISLGLGNYIGIYHPATDTYSYYAHLKKNSATVEIGEWVVAGQTIAHVGSSGNSTDPHLHYELWNPGILSDPTIDPWGTPCDLPANLWESSPTYDTSYAVWECGLVDYDSVDNFIPATWVPLKERFGQKESFSPDDSYFTFWALQYGLKIGDQTVIEWWDPDGELYASDTTTYLTQDWWFHYYNHAIPTPSLDKQGIWTIKYYYNGNEELIKSFSYGFADIESLINNQAVYYYPVNDNTIEIHLPKEGLFSNLTLYKITGEVLLQKEISRMEKVSVELPFDFSEELYLISVYNEENRYTFKVLFD